MERVYDYMFSAELENYLNEYKIAYDLWKLTKRFGDTFQKWINSYSIEMGLMNPDGPFYTVEELEEDVQHCRKRITDEAVKIHEALGLQEEIDKGSYDHTIFAELKEICTEIEDEIDNKINSFNNFGDYLDEVYDGEEEVI